MPKFTSGLELYRAQVERFKNVKLTLWAMHRQLADEGLQDARELTSGQISKAELRRQGYPYARRDQKMKHLAGGRQGGRAPLLPVNKQSGRLYDSMRESGSATGTGQKIDVGPDPGIAGKSMYGIKPGGTYKVVARGYWEEIKRRWRARNKALLDVMRKQMRS